MNPTNIEWVKGHDGSKGMSWNPITGCLNGCEYCYARKLANTRLKERYLANSNLAGGYRLARGVLKEGAIPPHLDPFYPRLWEDRLLDPLRSKGKKPKGIFTCDMSDLFGIGVPEQWTKRVLNTIIADSALPEDQQDRFYLLTKQPQNLIKFSPFPDNCWPGVSVDKATKTARTDKLSGAVQYLHDVEASVKYISFEPLLEWWWQDRCLDLAGYLDEAGINWVIIGAQTKPTVYPKIPASSR